MNQALSIRFQPPEQLAGPARDLFVQLKHGVEIVPGAGRDAEPAPFSLAPSSVQQQLNARTLRQRLRALERERALKTVDGTATWILTDRLSLNPELGERIGHAIVGPGLGKGRIVFGPPDLCLPAGRYIAVIECRVTGRADHRWARLTGEVILNNRQYLSQQTKTLTGTGGIVFRLPFRVREADLLRQADPMIEVRLNLRSIVGVEVTQVAVVSKALGLRSLAAHPIAHLRSAGNAALRRIGRLFAGRRA